MGSAISTQGFDTFELMIDPTPLWAIRGPTLAAPPPPLDTGRFPADNGRAGSAGVKVGFGNSPVGPAVGPG
jgi:hypothetical protein